MLVRFGISGPSFVMPSERERNGWNMGNESGEWIMYGLPDDDPECVHNFDELTALIDRVGFLPLFRSGIPGFSVQRHSWVFRGGICQPALLVDRRPGEGSLGMAQGSCPGPPDGIR